MKLSAEHRLYLATLVAGVGMGVILIYINWLIVAIYNRTSLISIISIASSLLIACSYPKMGALLDRTDRGKFLCLLYALGAAGLTALVFLCDHLPAIIPLFFCGLIIPLIRSLDQITRVALIQDLFSGKKIFTANKRIELIRQSITFFSGGLAVYLQSFLSLKFLLGFTAALFFASSIFSLNLSPQIQQKPRNTKEKNLWQDWKTCLKTCHAQPELMTFLFTSLMPYVLVVSQNVIYPSHFKDFLAVGPKAFAFLAVPYGLGALSAGWILKSHESAKKQILFWMTTLSFLYIPLIFIPKIEITYIVLAGMSLSHACTRILRNQILMDTFDKHLMAKLLSGMELCFLGASAALSLVLGVIADAFGTIQAWIVCAGLATLCVALLKKTPYKNTPTPTVSAKKSLATSETP